MNANPNDSSFEDPLENYEPKTYEDPLERAISEEPSIRIQHEPHTSVSPETTIAEAVQKLASIHVSCLLVEEHNQLVGVFTEREVLQKVALGEVSTDRPLREVMTTDPVFVRVDDPIASTLCVMAVHGYRHVPILGNNNEVVGIISPQRVTKFLSEHFNT